MASGLAAAYAAVRGAVAGAGLSQPISWFNDPFTPPAAAEWLAVRFVGGDGRPVTQAPTAGNERHALLQLDIYEPDNAGDGAALAMADTLSTLFSRANLYPVLFDVASAPKVAPSDQFGWQRLTLTVPFAVEETA